MSGKKQRKLTELDRLIQEYGLATFLHDIQDFEKPEARVSTMTIYRLRILDTGATADTEQKIINVLGCEVKDLYPKE